MRVTVRLLALTLAALLGACISFPDLEAARSASVDAAPYPTLLPLETLLDGPDPRASDADIAAIEARAAGLEARAYGLSGKSAPGSQARRLARLRQRAEALRAIR